MKNYTKKDIFKNDSDDTPITINNQPHDDVAENGVVGSVLKNPELITHAENLKASMFYNIELGVIYEIVYDLFNNDGVSKIDDYTIVSKIEEKPRYKNVLKRFSTKEIRSMLEKLKRVGTIDSNEYIRRCESVMNMDYRRKGSETLKTMVKFLESDLRDDINDVNVKVQDAIMKLSEDYLIDSSVQVIKDVIDEAWNEIESRRDGNSSVGFYSKFKSVNDYFTYEKGELIIVGGRAKAGKSMFFLNEVVHKLQNGVPCAILDTEMSTRQWIERFLSLYSGVTVANIKNGRYTSSEKEKILEGKNWLSQQPFAHIYDPEWTQEKIYTTAKILQRKIGLEFLVFDYIKAISTSKLQIQEHNHLGDMANYLKNNVAGKLNISVLAGGQMSPREQRLADSDKLNRYASVIAYWIKKPIEERSDSTSGTHKFFIEYNRLGSQFDEDEYIDMFFDGDHATIKQAKDGLQIYTAF